MRAVLAWTAVVLIGLVLGAGTAWWAIEAGRQGFAQEAGGWHWSRATGSESADMYTRAVVAREGILALTADEALYLTLSRDENGRPLDESCVYELSGPEIPARWWSVTLYARDNFLARNSDHAFSIDATELGGAPTWSARIAPVRGDAIAWISSRNARSGFSLTLRAYNPEASFPRDAGALPRLRTLSCPDAAQ